MQVRLSLSLNATMTHTSWNFWPLNGPLLIDYTNIYMVVLLTYFTDNNPSTYILTSAKLDAVGQHWVASLVNFSLHYNPGRQNTVGDSLSRIP